MDEAVPSEARIYIKRTRAPPVPVEGGDGIHPQPFSMGQDQSVLGEQVVGGDEMMHTRTKRSPPYATLPTSSASLLLA